MLPPSHATCLRLASVSELQWALSSLQCPIDTLILKLIRLYSNLRLPLVCFPSAPLRFLQFWALNIVKHVDLSTIMFASYSLLPLSALHSSCTSCLELREGQQLQYALTSPECPFYIPILQLTLLYPYLQSTPCGGHPSCTALPVLTKYQNFQRALPPSVCPFVFLALVAYSFGILCSISPYCALASHTAFDITQPY